MRNTILGSSFTSGVFLQLGVLFLCFIVVLPIFSLLLLALTGSLEDWIHLASSVLPHALKETLLLLVLVGILSCFFGVFSAWLIAVFDFPFRRTLSWMVVLPLSIPPYLAAYALFEFFNYTGPIQGTLRNLYGFQTIQDYWFPDIRSIGGASLVFSSVLYPYVYLTTRIVFLIQGQRMADAARTLGKNSSAVFFTVLLPLARPAIISGVSLVLMETLNDVGVAEYFGLQTLTLSVYSTWLNRGSLGGAAQIALVILIIVCLILLIENQSRRNQHFHVSHTTHLKKNPNRQKIFGWQAFFTVLFLSFPLLFGFFIPVWIFIIYAFNFSSWSNASVALHSAFLNSLLMAGSVTLLTILVALFIINASRFFRSSIIQACSQIVIVGYALPAGILALGLLFTFSYFDRLVDSFMIVLFHKHGGLLLTGSFLALIIACTIRFIAVAEESIKSGLIKLPPNLDAAARTLGRTASQSTVQVIFPLLLPAIFVAGVLVFVDSIKELSATILLRPFGFDTLATYIYERASRGAPEESALAALLIIASSLLPVFFLSKALADDDPSTKFT